jgi:uncharacterized membrane protein YdbT with pleckstrin-like domain
MAEDAVPYPEKILADDEQVVEHLHPHLIKLVPALLWFIVICAAAGFGIGAIHGHTHGTTRTVLVIVVLVVAIVLLLWLSFAPVVERATTHYVFTTHRVLIRTGVFSHTGRDISLQRINDVGFRQTLWERMVKAGTLTIESASEHGQSELEDVPRSDEQQQLLNRLIEEDGERRARLHHPDNPDA